MTSLGAVLGGVTVNHVVSLVPNVALLFMKFNFGDVIVGYQRKSA